MKSNTLLINDDCLKAMERLINDGIKVDMIFTDLPYGTTQCKWDTIIPLEPMWTLIKELINDDKTPLLFFAQQPFTSKLVSSNYEWYRHEWIYQKKRGTNFGSYKYAPAKVHESILVFSKKTPYYHPIKEPKAERTILREKYDYKRDDTEWEYNKLKTLSHKANTLSTLRYPISVRQINNLKSFDRGLHPTPKPLELLEYIIKTYSKEDDTVLDFTMGSGSTGVACLNTNRRFIGIELDKKYFDIAKDRINNPQTKLL